MICKVEIDNEVRRNDRVYRKELPEKFGLLRTRNGCREENRKGAHWSVLEEPHKNERWGGREFATDIWKYEIIIYLSKTGYARM